MLLSCCPRWWYQVIQSVLDVMKSKCQKPQWTWDGWMHWNEVEREAVREMGYRDAYLHANGESGLGRSVRASVLVGAVQYSRPSPPARPDCVKHLWQFLHLLHKFCSFLTRTSDHFIPILNFYSPTFRRQFNFLIETK